MNFTVTAEGKASIDGSFICGPASSRDDVSYTVGEVLDSFSIGPNLPPDSIIDLSIGDPAIVAGGPLAITVTPNRLVPE